MIFYVSWLPGTNAITLTPSLTIIERKFITDYPLQQHERVHQQQMRRVGTFAFWWNYLTDAQFRLAAEVEAYKVQIGCGASPLMCAVHLASMYRLNLTELAALKLLTSD